MIIHHDYTIGKICPISERLPQSPVLKFVQSEIQGWDAPNREIFDHFKLIMNNKFIHS